MLLSSIAFTSIAAGRLAQQELHTSVVIHNDNKGGAINIVLKENNFEAIYDVDRNHFLDHRTGFNVIPVDGAVDYQLKLNVSDHFCKVSNKDELTEYIGVSLQIDNTPFLLGEPTERIYHASSTNWHELIFKYPKVERQLRPIDCYGMLAITAELSEGTI